MDSYKTCKNVAYSHLVTYAEFVFRFHELDEVGSLLNILDGQGYGDSIEGIDGFFRRHFSACSDCSKAYAHELRDLKSKGLLFSKLIPSYEHFHSLKKKFLFDHLSMDVNAYALRDYVSAEAAGNAQKKDADLEFHVSRCDSCKTFMDISHKVGQEFKEVMKHRPG